MQSKTSIEVTRLNWAVRPAPAGFGIRGGDGLSIDFPSREAVIALLHGQLAPALTVHKG